MPQEQTRDYYEDLQVSSSAEPETIHRVYRLLAQQFHPDNGESGNDARFRLIAEAYQVSEYGHQPTAEELRRLFPDGTVFRTG